MNVHFMISNTYKGIRV